MSALEARLISQTLEQRWQKYLSYLKACMEDPNSESIHELRVSARRLFAVFELLRTIQPSPELQTLQRELKNQLNDLDKISDVQMMAAEIEKILGEYPMAQPFFHHLRKREKSLRRKALKHLHSLDDRKLEKQIHLVEKVQAGNWNSEEGLHALALRALDRAFRLTLERYRLIDTDHTETIHRVRIAFRKFRYIIEIVYPALPGYPDTLLREMRLYQRKMGTIQDLETLLRSLEKYAHKHKKFDGAEVIQHYRQQHRQAVLDFQAQMDNLYRFWRHTKTSPFPWLSSRPDEATASEEDSAWVAENTKHAALEEETNL